MAENYSAADRRNHERDWSAPEIARRNVEWSGKPISNVMKTAATACELAHRPSARRKAPDPS